MNLPSLLYHADWSSSPAKRWCAKATLGSDGHYSASEPELVGDSTKMLESLRADAGESGIVFAGFDFPIGFPEQYARRAGINGFRETLPELGTGKWRDFFQVCEKPEEVSVFRPFYPNQSKKGCLQQHLLDGHNALNMAALLRRCELGGDGRRQACSLFWTLGANAVGKAAIAGWRDVLVPALNSKSVRFWPFNGDLKALFQPGNTVIAETYPAECYRLFSDKPLGSKTDEGCRKRFGTFLLTWANGAGVTVEPQLEYAIKEGFPKGEDDAFDAVVGLFGMLQIVLGQRCTGEPNDDVVREIEGWILGRQANDATVPEPLYSAASDPTLCDWLRWAADSGEAPVFVKTVAEAASIADLKQYRLLRQVLLELKREYPHSACG